MRIKWRCACTSGLCVYTQELLSSIAWSLAPGYSYPHERGETDPSVPPDALHPDTYTDFWNGSKYVSEFPYCNGVFVYLEWRSGKQGVCRKNRVGSGSWNRSELGFWLARLLHATAWHLIDSTFHPAPAERERCAFRMLIKGIIVNYNIMFNWFSLTLKALKTVRPSNFSWGVCGERRPL